MTENRKPKHVSFELGEPVTREEVELAGAPLPPNDDFITVHFTSIAVDDLAALRADLASEQRWACHYHEQAEALEAKNQRLRADLNAIAEMILNAWNIADPLGCKTYVDPIQGARVICDEVREMRDEIKHWKTEVARLSAPEKLPPKTDRLTITFHGPKKFRQSLIDKIYAVLMEEDFLSDSTKPGCGYDLSSSIGPSDEAMP